MRSRWGDKSIGFSHLLNQCIYILSCQKETGKMKPLNFLCIFLFLSACSSSKTSSDTQNDSSLETQFADCFTAPPADHEQLVVGCSQGFYKVIGDQFVLRLNPEIDLAYGECKEWKVEATNEDQFNIELLVFKKGEASLMNICSGAYNTQAPEPFKRLNKCLGKITVGKSDPTNYQGQELPKMTFQIEQLVFIDMDTYEEIVIQDKLMWKVQDGGMPK